MNLNAELTENLTLNFIEENFFEGNKLITVELSFTFFGKDCLAYLKIEELDKSWPSYAMTESDGEISESFNSIIEDDDVFENIKKHVKTFAKKWEEDNVYD